MDTLIVPLRMKAFRSLLRQGLFLILAFMATAQASTLNHFSGESEIPTQLWERSEGLPKNLRERYISSFSDSFATAGAPSSWTSGGMSVGGLQNQRHTKLWLAPLQGLKVMPLIYSMQMSSELSLCASHKQKRKNIWSVLPSTQQPWQKLVDVSELSASLTAGNWLASQRHFTYKIGNLGRGIVSVLGAAAEDLNFGLKRTMALFKNYKRRFVEVVY